MNFGAEVILLQTTHNNKTAAEQQSPLPTVMDDDPLTLTGIQKHLLIPDLSLTIRREVTSTNTLLRQTAMDGAKEGTVLLAQKQTGGKGRMGRAFYSPADTGVYCSILLRPQSLDLCDAANVTTIAAVAACEAIEIAGAGSASIKWVNDVFVSGKKVCGILTEGAVDPATSQAEFLIVGVGINVYPPRDGFPPELSHIAGSVFPTTRPDGRNRLAAFFLNRFFAYYKTEEKKVYPARYRERCFVLGKQILVIRSEKKTPAKALDVDKDCRLLVEYENGKKEYLESGEISIRPLSE